jgi:hypothetical protein
MDSIPFGLSVHHFISSVGADAGFASLIGLALLVLLYFAHARETATLRSRADAAGLRVQELEAQLADLADQIAALPAEISVRAASPRAAAAYAGGQERAAAGVGAAGTGRGGPFPPAAPAGVAAPALAAATRMIPLPDLPLPQPEPQPATVAGASNGSSRIPVGASATVQRPVQAPAGGVVGVGGVPRGPAGPGRAGGAPVRPTGGGRPGAGQPRAAAAQARSGAGRPAMPMRPAPRRSNTGRILAAIAVAAVGAAAVVAAVLLLTNRGGSQTPSSSAMSSRLASHRSASRSAAVVRPSTVTVAVLNGTDQSGLAGRISARLVSEGYHQGAIGNASVQTHTTSLVQYMTPADRQDALAVAASLKLSATSVQAIDSGTQQIACSAAPPPCKAAVVVTVGSNLASQ